MLRIGLNTREEDVLRELQSVKQSASLILQRRKATAVCLRKLSENAMTLSESQLWELKCQLKVHNWEWAAEKDCVFVCACFEYELTSPLIFCLM